MQLDLTLALPAASAYRPARDAVSALQAASAAGWLGESWRAWTALAIGVMAISAQTASSMTFSVLMKPMLAELGCSRTDFTAAMTLRMTLMVLLLAYAGLLTDHMGARLVLVAGALIIGLGNLAMARVGSLAQLFGVMAWLGPGQAAIGSVAASALVLRLFTQRRSLAVGILNGGDNLLNSGVYYLAAVLLGTWGWRPTIGSLGALYLLLAGLIFRALRPAAGERTEWGAGRGVVRLRDVPWRDRRLWLVCATFAAFGVWAVIYGLVNGGVVALLALVLDELFGAEQIGRLMGLAMVFCMAATMLGNNFSAFMFERTGSYVPAWRTYTGLMLLTLVPVAWLHRQAAQPAQSEQPACS